MPKIIDFEIQGHRSKTHNDSLKSVFLAKMTDLMSSIHSRMGQRYYYSFIGPYNESLHNLLDIDEQTMQQILFHCGMYNIQGQRFTKGITDSWTIFGSCILVKFHKKEAGPNNRTVTKQMYYVGLGKSETQIKDVKDQYTSKVSIPNNTAKIHHLAISPPEIRLSRHEKEVRDSLVSLLPSFTSQKKGKHVVISPSPAGAPGTSIATRMSNKVMLQKIVNVIHKQIDGLLD